MAKDDINVIMYKILRYLYECKLKKPCTRRAWRREGDLNP